MASSSEPLVIQNLKIVLADNRWQDTDSLPRLEVRIAATSSGKDIAAIKYIFQDEKNYHQFSLSEDIINSIVSQLNDDKSELVWDETEISHINLLNNLEKIMRYMSTLDINSMANLYPQIFDMDIISHPNYRQWFVDVFLAQVSFYLVFCDLMYKELIQHSFPMKFDMPFDKLDGRILTKYAMNYMRYPLRSLKILGSIFVRELEWIIVGFFNGWSDMYMKGDYVDIQRLHYELTHEMAEALLTEIDARTTKLENLLRLGMQQNMSVRQDLNIFRLQMKHVLDQINEVFSQIGEDITELKSGSVPVIMARVEPPVFREPPQPHQINFISIPDRQMSPPPNGLT